MQPHGVVQWVMQHHIDVIEGHNWREPHGQIMKQIVQVAVRRD
jgi:hypothetical protein